MKEIENFERATIYSPEKHQAQIFPQETVKSIGISTGPQHNKGVCFLRRRRALMPKSVRDKVLDQFYLRILCRDLK